MPLSNVEIRSSLLAVMRGDYPGPPNYVDYFIEEGWVEAVDVNTREIVPRDHPKAVLRLTAAGQERMSGRS